MNTQAVPFPQTAAPRRSTTVAFLVGFRSGLGGKGAPGSRRWTNAQASNYRELHYFFDLGAKLGLKLE